MAFRTLAQTNDKKENMLDKIHSRIQTQNFVEFSWNADWHEDVKWDCDDRLISPDTISQGTRSPFTF